MSRNLIPRNIFSPLVNATLVGSFVALSAQAATAIMVTNSYTDDDNNTFEYSFSALEDDGTIMATDLTEFMGSFTTSKGSVASINLADLNAPGGTFLFTQDSDGSSTVRLKKGSLDDSFQFNGDLKMGFLSVAQVGPAEINFNSSIVSTNFGSNGTNSPAGGTNSPKNVPEPLTVFGTLTALLFGWRFKGIRRHQ